MGDQKAISKPDNLTLTILKPREREKALFENLNHAFCHFFYFVMMEMKR